MTGLEKRVTDEVYIEYPFDKGVDERIICWNQRLELYKGIEYGSRKLLHPISSSVSRGVGNEPMESSPLQAEIQERTREPDHYQLFQDYFSDHASRAAFVFQSQQLRIDENRFVISILRQLILEEQQSSEAMFRQLKDITNAVVTSRMIGVTEATARQDLEMNLFGFDDEESTRDDDEKDREGKEPVGDTRKKEILDDVRETIQHHQKNVSRLEGQYKTSNERLQKLEEGFSQLYSCLFGANIPYTTNNELKNIFSNMQHKVKENSNMASSKEQEHDRLRQQLDKLEKEKKELQNEKNEWRIKAESMESFCLVMEAKLLPEDPIREIQNLRVEDSKPDDNDIEMNDSPIFVDYEKTLESINMTLKKENMELKDTITGLKKLQRDETEKSESQLQRQVVALTNENDEMKIEFRQLYFRAFGTELPPSSQRPYATILKTLEDFTNNLRAESSKKERRIQELEQASQKTTQTLWKEQADKSDIQAQLDIKTQALSSLEDELQQTKEEKACIQNKGDQWKAQIDELENHCKTFQAKLLPVDFTREIVDLEVKIGMLNNRENHQDVSDGSARNSILKLKEELETIKLSVKNKEQSRSALEEEKNDLLNKILKLEDIIKTETDENKSAHGKIKELEALRDMNQQNAIGMKTQIGKLKEEIKNIQQKEQNYKDIIEQYENQIIGINDLIETRTEQITEVEQFLKDAEAGVREQNQAFVKVKQELEAAQADAANKEETYRLTYEETVRLKQKLEEMEQIKSRNNKKVDDLKVQLQDAEREIGKLTTTLATVESTLDRERITSACDIEDLSMKVDRLEKTKQEYEVSIDASENLHRRLREMEEEERTKAMNVQNAIERKDDTISRLGKDIENIKEGHIREISRLTEEIGRLNNQLAKENRGNNTVTNVSDRSYAIPELPEVALQKLERWKESGNKFAESQKRTDHVFSTIEGLPSRLEQVLTTYQPSASADSIAQAARDEILTRLEINVKDLKHAIDRQHISSQENAESNRTCHSIEEINKLMACVNQQREKLSKELSRLTEEASQLNSGFKDKDKQCNEAVNTLLTYQSKCESEFDRLSEIIPVLEIKQLTEQIHELQDQIRALGPELKDKNQDLGTFREDICGTKAQTMHYQGDMNQTNMIIEKLPSDIQNLNSKLINIEKGMVQQQIAYDEWRKSSHNTPTRNTQQDENSNVSELKSQLSDLFHVISQLRDKDRLMKEAQKLQDSTTERDSKLNCLKDTMDWLVEEVRKLQKRIRDSEAEAQERQCDMAKFLRLSTRAWISQKPTEEATSKLNVNDDCRDELDGLREELGQVEKNIMYFTSTFPPPSGNRFSTVMEERFLGKVRVTERLKVLIERVRYRIDDLQSSLEQAKLSSESAMLPERTRSTIVSQGNEVATPVSELNMEFSTPMGQESGIIQSPTVQRPPRPLQHNADIRGCSLPDGSPISGPRSSVNSAFAQPVIKDASKILITEGHEASHASADKPGDSRKFEEHALDSDSVRGDLERLRASLIFHLCTMLFSRERTVNMEALREGSRIFSRRTIGKGNLELLEKVIEGYSMQSMKSRGANKELRKITYKGRKAFPDPLLKIYTTIFKTLLALTMHLDINEPQADAESTKGKAAPRDNGTNIQEGTRKTKRKHLNLAQHMKDVK